MFLIKIESTVTISEAATIDAEDAALVPEAVQTCIGYIRDDGQLVALFDESIDLEAEAFSVAIFALNLCVFQFYLLLLLLSKEFFFSLTGCIGEFKLSSLS